MTVTFEISDEKLVSISVNSKFIYKTEPMEVITERPVELRSSQPFEKSKFDGLDLSGKWLTRGGFLAIVTDFNKVTDKWNGSYTYDKGTKEVKATWFPDGKNIASALDLIERVMEGKGL